MPTQPTIAMIPSGYGLEKIYSVLPTNGDADLQFSRGSVATRVDKSGLISNVQSNFPRLDYSDSTCPSLLLEPQRTNLVLESNNFNNYFSKLNSSVVESNQTISPDGTLNADKVIRGTADLCLRRNSQVSVGVQNTFSVYAKKGTSSTLRLDIGDEGSKEFILTDNWQRFIITATPSSYSHIDIELPNANQGDYIYVFGTQVEQAVSYPTSYIPTTGTSVTRLAETAFKTGVDAYINSSEGVLFAEISALANDLTTTAKPITISQSSTNLLGFYYFQSRIDAYVRVNGVNQFLKSHSLDPTINNKISLKYKTNDFALWINGFEIATDTNGTTPSGLNQLRFDDLSDKFYGKTKDLRVYNTALTDLELETLTSFTSFNAMALALNYTIY